MIWGNLAAIAAALLWAVASVLFTREGERTRPSVINLVKSCLGLALFAVCALILPPGWLRNSGLLGVGLGMSPSLLAVLLLSGIIGIGLGDTFYLVSLNRIGVRRTMTIGLLAPIFTAFGAWWVGQPLPGWIGFAGMGMTLLGVFLVIRAVAPGAPVESMGARFSAILFAVLSALCQAAGIVMTKDVLTTVGVMPVCMLRLGAGIVGLLIIESFRAGRAELPREFLQGVRRSRLLLAAFLGTFVGFFFFQLAIRLGSPPVTAALVGTSPLFVAPLAAHYLGERMPWVAALGTAVSVGGVVLLVLG